MTWHLILFFTLVITIAAIAYMVGGEAERKKLHKQFKGLDIDGVEHAIRRRRSLFDGTWIWFIGLAAVLSMWFAFSYADLRECFINGYRDGRIIESVTYRYENVGGEKVLTDSTRTYKVRKP